MSLFPGPPELGRGIVVLAEDPVPSEAASWPRFVLDEASVSKPRPLAEVLHAHWLARTPFVLELRADPEILREAERCELPPYEVDAGHDFARERLQYLVWSNNYDARSTRGVDPGRQPGEPIWWHGRRAQRLGAKPSERADALFPDGSHAWCDGGPRGPVGDTAGEGLAICHRESLESGQLLLDRAAPAAAELAPDQLAAVAHGSGPARIIAPAGSGKTRVLTERLRHLLLDRGVTPGTVTAVAYNKRAADELLERTAPLRAHIRTLNSLGLAIVNGSAPFADPGGSRRRVIDEPEVRQILQSLVPVRRQLNTDPWIPYLEALSAIRLGLTPPEVVEETYPDAAGIAGAFDSYRLVLAEQNLVDFDEQIYLAIELL
ncbi:MAG: UvrD-helicase domain-containing protein, partial [Acidimicrobiales bacterium]